MKPTASGFYSEYRKLQKQRSRALVRRLKFEHKKDNRKEHITYGDLNVNAWEISELLQEIGNFFIDKYLQTKTLSPMEENEKTTCDQPAQIIVVWANKPLRLCPVHANNLAKIGEAIGKLPEAILLPSNSIIKCEGGDLLTEEEKSLCKNFPLTNPLI